MPVHLCAQRPPRVWLWTLLCAIGVALCLGGVGYAIASTYTAPPPEGTPLGSGLPLAQSYTYDSLPAELGYKLQVWVEGDADASAALKPILLDAGTLTDTANFVCGALDAGAAPADIAASIVGQRGLDAASTADVAATGYLMGLVVSSGCPELRDALTEGEG